MSSYGSSSEYGDTSYKNPNWGQQGQSQTQPNMMDSSNTYADAYDTTGGGYSTGEGTYGTSTNPYADTSSTMNRGDAPMASGPRSTQQSTHQTHFDDSEPQSTSRYSGGRGSAYDDSLNDNTIGQGMGGRGSVGHQAGMGPNMQRSASGGERWGVPYDQSPMARSSVSKGESKPGTGGWKGAAKRLARRMSGQSS